MKWGRMFEEFAGVLDSTPRHSHVVSSGLHFLRGNRAPQFFPTYFTGLLAQAVGRGPGSWLWAQALTGEGARYGWGARGGHRSDPY